MGRKEGVRDLLRRDGDGKRRKWEMRDGKGERKGKENEGRRAACPTDKKNRSRATGRKDCRLPFKRI